VKRALSGPDLVTPSRAEALVKQADAKLQSTDDDDDDDEDDDDQDDDGPSVDELWADVTEPGDGTIVVIDTEEETDEIATDDDTRRPGESSSRR